MASIEAGRPSDRACGEPRRQLKERLGQTPEVTGGEKARAQCRLGAQFPLSAPALGLASSSTGLVALRGAERVFFSSGCPLGRVGERPSRLDDGRALRGWRRGWRERAVGVGDVRHAPGAFLRRKDRVLVLLDAAAVSETGVSSIEAGGAGRRGEKPDNARHGVRLEHRPVLAPVLRRTAHVGEREGRRAGEGELDLGLLALADVDHVRIACLHPRRRDRMNVLDAAVVQSQPRRSDERAGRGERTCRPGSSGTGPRHVRPTEF